MVSGSSADGVDGTDIVFEGGDGKGITFMVFSMVFNVA